MDYTGLNIFWKVLMCQRFLGLYLNYEELKQDSLFNPPIVQCCLYLNYEELKHFSHPLILVLFEFRCILPIRD
jgi:hypothetical protein